MRRRDPHQLALLPDADRIRTQRVCLPALYRVKGTLLRNNIQQLGKPEITCKTDVERYTARRINGHVVNIEGSRTLVVKNRVAPPPGIDQVLRFHSQGVPADRSAFGVHNENVSWLSPKAINVSAGSLGQFGNKCDEVRQSWRDKFAFREEQCDTEGKVTIHGLRSPQIGALYSALAHWKVTNAPATIVMPTGTGKTETMLALLVHERLKRLLVVVPSDSLRTQITDKFVSLGILQKCGIVDANADYPVVGTLRHRLRTPEEVELFFGCCNVIVTTMGVVSGCEEIVQEKMAEMTSHLFIDEAHHISAPTWDRFRRFFLEKNILQFTATPYRSDGKHIDGKIIFNYPLRKAQQEGYFKNIQFLPVREYYRERADEAIATTAIAQLATDLENGHDHIVMARASDIQRATAIHQVYQSLAPEYNPQLIHSRLGPGDKVETLRLLDNRESRVIVCVDMLGEGFDFPELKIAALHDIHKSPAITLQFTGRFTRTKDTIGDATMVANIADATVEDSLQELYAEDPDWNYLLHKISEGATGRELRRSDTLDGFVDPPAEIPIQNVFPKMSTVVYRVRGTNWRPDRLGDIIPEKILYAGPTINHEKKIVLFATRDYEPVSWGDIKGLNNTIYDLYLLHWDSRQGLLFINSSNNDSAHEELAKCVAGDDAELIRGEQVFRSLHGINRLMLTNLGLNHSLSRAVRFTMYAGSDVRQGLSEAHLQNKYKSNLFGRGFELGDKASLGCSHRGRIWSHKIAYDVSEWTDWCHQIGAKLLDATISVRSILDHVIIPEQIEQRPPLVPIAIEWSEAFLQRSEDIIKVDISGESMPFYEVGLEVSDHTNVGPIRFRVFTQTQSAEYELQFEHGRVNYVPTGNQVADIIVSRRRRSLSDWFQDEPPIIHFATGESLIYNQLYQPSATAVPPFDRARIETWDWEAVNIRRESQTTSKFEDSIQYRVIHTLLDDTYGLSYDIVFDDDDTNEAADIVAVKVVDERLIVHLFHCKYSSEDTPGARVADLYPVCGQAQRSITWKGNTKGLFNHLRNRELSRLRSTGVSRFEKGDMAALRALERQEPTLAREYKIWIVQPGLSKTAAATNQLELLAVTELYLRETYDIGFGVIASR